MPGLRRSLRSPWAAGILALTLLAIVLAGWRLSRAPGGDDTAPAGSTVARPRTVPLQLVPLNKGPIRTAAVTKGPIYALAQDGNRLVWVEQAVPAEECDSGNAVVFETLLFPGGRPRPFLTPDTCSWQNVYRLALAGSRVVWAVPWGGNTSSWNVRTIAVGERKFAELEGEMGLLFDNAEGFGEVFGDAAGDGGVLAYSVVRGHGGQTKRVLGRRSRVVQGTHAYRVAVDAPAIASLSDPQEYDDGQHVVVRNARSGASLVTFDVKDGIVRDVALTRRYVVLRVVNGAKTSIAFHDVRSGRHVRTMAVHADARSLSASERGVLYAAGSDIYLIATPSLEVGRVARAGEPSHSLGGAWVSIEDSRVVWAERAGAGSRIRAVTIR